MVTAGMKENIPPSQKAYSRAIALWSVQNEHSTYYRHMAGAYSVHSEQTGEAGRAVCF